MAQPVDVKKPAGEAGWGGGWGVVDLLLSLLQDWGMERVVVLFSLLNLLA